VPGACDRTSIRFVWRQRWSEQTSAAWNAPLKVACRSARLIASCPPTSLAINRPQAAHRISRVSIGMASVDARPRVACGRFGGHFPVAAVTSCGRLPWPFGRLRSLSGRWCRRRERDLPGVVTCGRRPGRFRSPRSLFGRRQVAAGSLPSRLRVARLSPVRSPSRLDGPPPHRSRSAAVPPTCSRPGHRRRGRSGSRAA